MSRLALALTVLLAGNAGAQTSTRYINPPGLAKPTGYTHVVVSPDQRTAYIAGQVALDSAGKLVGADDFKAQAEQVFVNLRRALAGAGASLGQVMKTTTYITDARHIPALREIRNRHLGPIDPPASTLLIVSGLARLELLIEIEAVAALRPPVIRELRE